MRHWKTTGKVIAHERVIILRQIFLFIKNGYTNIQISNIYDLDYPHTRIYKELTLEKALSM